MSLICFTHINIMQSIGKSFHEDTIPEERITEVVARVLSKGLRRAANVRQ
jgi:hypothetical protein